MAPGQLLDVFIESAGDAGAPDPVAVPVTAPAVAPTSSAPKNAAATAPDHAN